MSSCLSCKAVAATVARDAETAMYRAKEAGRDRYEVFNDDFHHRSVTRLALESDLRLALKRRQFEVYYQAGLSLPDGMPMGAEALIRWHHPKRGMVPPLEFIPVAEDSGMINAIGAWVFEQAVAQLASWDADVDGPRLNVLAVNLSARQMDEPDTSDVIRNVLARYGVDPARVCFELTESAVMTQSASTREALTDVPGTRGEGGNRRLRHRVFVSRLPAHPPGVDAQDRPFLHRTAGQS